MKLIFDSGPLIYLGKIKVLEKLSSFQNIIPQLVYEEVVEEGKKLGKEDAFYLEDLIKKKVFTVIKAKTIIGSLPDENLSKADQEVISLAKQERALAVIDEEIGRKIAEVIGVETLGSVGILFNLLNKNLITRHELKEYVEKMVSEGWFCSTTLYAKIIEELNIW